MTKERPICSPMSSNGLLKMWCDIWQNKLLIAGTVSYKIHVWSLSEDYIARVSNIARRNFTTFLLFERQKNDIQYLLGLGEESSPDPFDDEESSWLLWLSIMDKIANMPPIIIIQIAEKVILCHLCIWNLLTAVNKKWE